MTNDAHAIDDGSVGLTKTQKLTKTFLSADDYCPHRVDREGQKK
jgi:hypothetical protein